MTAHQAMHIETPPRRDRYETGIAAAILAALTLLVYGDVLFSFGPRIVSSEQGDASLYFAPYRAFGFAELARGNFVLWNPHVFSGAPFFGGFQVALLYPLNAIYLMFPLAFALNLDICVHTFLAGFFTYLWVRPSVSRMAPALLAAAMMMFGAAFSLRVLAGQLTMLSTLCYAPLLLLCVDRIFEAADAKAPRLGWALVGILAVSLQALGGYPGSLFMTAFTAGVYCAIRFAIARGRSGVILPLAAIAIAPLGIACVQLWAGAQTAAESIRAGGGSYLFATSYSFPPENLLSALVPGLLGDGLRAEYWGRWNFWDASLFAGITGLLFAAAGVAYGRRRRSAAAAFIVLLILAIALGRYTPLYRFFHAYVPGFAHFRAPSKFAFFAALFVAQLAALGMDALAARPPRARWLGGAAGALAMALGAAAAGLTLAARGPGDDTPWRELLAWARGRADVYLWVSSSTDEFAAQAQRLARNGLLLAAGTAGLLCAILWISPRRPRFVLAAGILGIAEVAVFARAHRDTFVLAFGERPAVNAAYATAVNGERVVDMVRFDSRVRNYAMEVGGRAVFGYDPVILRRYGEFMSFAAAGFAHAEQVNERIFIAGDDPFGVALNRGFNRHTEHGFERGQKFLALARPRFIVRTPVAPEFREFVTYLTKASAPLKSRGEPPPIEFSDVESYYEIPVAYPEFFLADQYLIKAATLDTLYELATKGVDFAHTAVLEDEPSPAPDTPGPLPGTVTVRDRSTDHVTLHVETPVNSILMVLNSYSAGWRVIPVPGSAQADYRVMPADYTFMAVPLSAGVHDFRLEYSPAGWRYGRWISLASLAGYACVVGWWAARRTRRRLSARPPESP